MASHRIPFDVLASEERARLLAENERLRQTLREQHRSADLAGTSDAIRRVRDLIAQIAPSSQSVCICGEPGVGKARAARAIHRASPRSSAAFVRVSCAALNDASADAQLFGPGETAADLGATGGCIGRAAGGTVFFDELADLGPLAQRRIVQVAQERSWQRASGPLSTDVRVVAASNRNIEALVERGIVRRDLWDHIGALTITLPPLRARAVDLPLLTDLFVEQFAREHIRAVRGVSERAMDMLMNYEWPGNIAELCRTIERAVVLTTGPIIHHHHLPAEIQSAGRSPAPAVLGLGEALEAYEKELLRDALKRARGVRSLAARLLMTSERVLGYRLRKYGIDSRRFKVS